MKGLLSTEPYKGVRDFYPQEQAFLNYFANTCRGVAERMGYVEYGASILEPAELYKAKGAENEEMVREQTYTFTDRGGRLVTLRPEMTPTIARMVAAKRRLMGYPLRLYSIPNVFRYERPQRGRLREHWQLNVDLFGSHSSAADAEIIAVAYGVMKAFGAKDEDFEIRVNSRGLLDAVVKEHKLSPEQEQKLRRLLDARNKMASTEFETGLEEIGLAPAMLPADAPAAIRRMLDEFKNMGMKNVVFDPSIVRGFNYYTGMVFEVYDLDPKNSRSLFGGGRYDNLTALFDTEPLPGVGFGMGDVTLHDFLETHNLLPAYKPPTQVYFAITAPELATKAHLLGAELRMRGVNVAIDFGEKKLAEQIKAAVKHQIPYLVVVGKDEIASGQFKLRELESGQEQVLTLADIAKSLRT